MRKQTKLVAVLSATALLAIGASMTSFAAQGWAEEGGTWVYYNKDGSMATDQWKKSGNNWYWLTSDGTMATDQIVEDDNDYFYVDANGVMVTNQWVQVDNVDDIDENSPSNWWYYFQGNGKAYQANDSNNTSLKTINGKKYAFDDEGRMLFGWVDDTSTRQTDDAAWENALYYFGDEDDGSAAIGWAQIHVIDDNRNWDKKNEENEDQDYWFYFQSNGKKIYADRAVNGIYLKTKTINGKKYGFDEHGRMTFEWTQKATYDSVGTRSTASAVSNYSYFNDRDNGARVTKGWFKTVPDPDINTKDDDDDEERWFYAYSNGKLCYSEFKTINGKRYAFDNSGRMLTDLQAVYTDSYGRVWNKKLDDEDLVKDGTELRDGGKTELVLINSDGDEQNISDYNNPTTSVMTIEDAINYVANHGTGAGEDPFAGNDSHANKKPTFGVFYFGNSGDGAIRTSTQTINIEGDAYTFYFKKDGERKGEGINGLKDNYLYQNGKRVKADKDNKYEAYFVAAANGAVGGLYDYSQYCEDQTVFLKGHAYQVDPDKVDQLYADIQSNTTKVGISDQAKTVGRIFLVNTSGSITNGSKDAKDGNDMYYRTDNKGCVTKWWDKDGYRNN